MMSAALLALVLSQFTSVQLPPLSFDVDTTKLSLVDKCNTVPSRYSRLTNTGRATLFVTQGLVSGYHFNGALQGGTLGDVKPGEYTDLGALFAPVYDPRPQQGQFEILVRYHDSSVEEERQRIRKLAAEKLAELKAQGEKLEETFLERFERLSMRMRIEHQKIENENTKKRAEAIDKGDKLKDEYKAARREYEQGLFCSGCGKTRSYLLARREPFPHPGERPVRATDEQLDALKSEYEGLIKAQKGRIEAARTASDASYQAMQKRVRELGEQRRDERAALDASLAELSKKQDDINKQLIALLHELHERSTESKTVLVKLYGRCTLEKS